jgi:hypothetical protein
VDVAVRNQAKAMKQKISIDANDSDANADDDSKDQGWGSKKGMYYNADVGDLEVQLGWRP